MFGGLVALAGALVYAELASIRPAVGGQYAYLREAFHPRVAFVYGWVLLLVSQSGGMSHLLAFTAMRRQVRFSKIVGLGNRLNVDFAEMVAYLVEDPDTKVILLYIEGLEAHGNTVRIRMQSRTKKERKHYEVEE